MTQHDHIELRDKESTDESTITTVIIQLSDEPPRKRPRIAVKKFSEKHQCNVCLKLFTQKANMTKHIQQIHTKESQHPCTICKKVFTQKGHLKQHVKNVHEKLREHQCTFCKKYFSSRSYIVVHMKNIHKKL